jgi:soluble lytic murein transglycosylase
MERRRRLSSAVFDTLSGAARGSGVGTGVGRGVGRAAALSLLLLLGGPAAAQLGEATRTLYTARLADNAAGRFTGFSGSPLVGVAQVPALEAVVTWDRLRRDSYKGSFAEYALFLRDNPDWPQSLVIRRQAEKMIDERIAAPDRIAFFQRFPPLSAVAKLRLAEALQAVGRRDEASAMARDAWDSAGLDVLSEAQLLARFENVLTADDHLGRADRLVWSGQTSAAGRLLPRLDMDHRLWLLARLALRNNSPDATNRLAGVPEALRTEPGLLLDRALWLRRTGDTAAANALLANTELSPGLVLDPETWLKVRLEFARAAWRAGDSEIAYRLAARHSAFPLGRPLTERSLGERAAFIESEWLAGWLALRKLNRPDDAWRHFQNVRSAAQTPISQTRGDYWTGRAAEAAGRAADAKAAYEAAAVHFDYFYGQLAAEKLGRKLAIKRQPAPKIDPDRASTFRADPLVRATFALGDLGDRLRQNLFVRTLAERAQSVDDAALVAGLAGPLKRPDLGVLAGKAARSDGELALIDAAFPTIELPASLAPSFTMAHAITRQESQFDAQVVSAARAYGLMQLLPSTAAEQANKVGLPVSTPRLLSDPVYNLTLGSGYFARLRNGFDGNFVLSVAAYNAGAGNVRKFIAINGDPRQPGVDVLDWVESIPFSETRNYVQRVLENAVVYDLLHPATAVMPTSNRLSAYLGKKTPG